MSFLWKPGLKKIILVEISFCYCAKKNHIKTMCGRKKSSMDHLKVIYGLPKWRTIIVNCYQSMHGDSIAKFYQGIVYKTLKLKTLQPYLLTISRILKPISRIELCHIHHNILDFDESLSKAIYTLNANFSLNSNSENTRDFETFSYLGFNFLQSPSNKGQ